MRDQRGAIYLEMLIGYLPVIALFFGVLQIADIAAAHLVVQRAAAVAVRAAVVVLPDDEAFYTGTELQPADRKLADVQRAATTVLRAMRRLSATRGNVELNRDATIEHDRERIRQPVTATVRARYRCFARVFCGLDGSVMLSAEATLPYQGAAYRYDSEGG